MSLYGTRRWFQDLPNGCINSLHLLPYLFPFSLSLFYFSFSQSLLHFFNFLLYHFLFFLFLFSSYWSPLAFQQVILPILLFFSNSSLIHMVLCYMLHIFLNFLSSMTIGCMYLGKYHNSLKSHNMWTLAQGRHVSYNYGMSMLALPCHHPHGIHINNERIINKQIYKFGWLKNTFIEFLIWGNS